MYKHFYIQDDISSSNDSITKISNYDYTPIQSSDNHKLQVKQPFQ